MMLIAALMLVVPGTAYAQEFAWARSAGGEGADASGGVAVDPAGNSIMLGTYSETASFGTGASEQVILTGEGVSLAKYNGLGALIWAKRAASGGDGQGIAVDAAGNSIVGGTFSGTVTFGEEDKAITLNAISQTDFFLAKYDTHGTL